ncbi:2-dehydro-3-deoxygalactonokinase [Falsirhodobacter halotolerans]|uniref:2-dehydro-3-deoxygalactonokinase n=1 Tax=Falsirhodobacter halotolerans TaxID=1146892 RepID=UPI001FD5647C|nr:2-dehydro-3-deoxygalactonokinase [Falsirhodobacter halotolerans]MCJ8139247.1 2-dehydro-3-deoxygalactonokinase [Falsirhodobacter halotolerans]
MTNELVALDWGTSSLRAFLMRDGQVVAERTSPHGIQNLPTGGFAGAFADICGDWVAQGRPVVAGGMVGSQQGWAEAPYARCPARLEDLIGQGAEVALPQGGVLHIVPGVLLDTPGAPPDVMRGEEVQIAGAIADRPDLAARALFVLPGTHSKWVLVEGGRIVTFATYMTGEMFALLRGHSILGRLMTDAPAFGADAFDRGVGLARQGGAGDLTRQIFSARTMGLTGRLPGSGLADYLSGLLIGSEIRSAARMRDAASPPVLMIGDGALCDRYRRALTICGIEVAAQLGNTAPHGLWRFAEIRGLVTAAPPKDARA